MSWFKEQKKTSYLRSFCNNVIKAGQLPRHVAIIMDGNRRFAKKVNCERSKGHEKGFEKLTEVRGFMNSFSSHQFTQMIFSYADANISLLAENSDVSCEIVEISLHTAYTSTEIFVTCKVINDEQYSMNILSFILA